MEYETKDFPLICFLAYMGYHSTVRKEGSVCYFNFENVNPKDIDGFWNGTLTVEPRAFFATISMVKSRMYH